MENFHCPKCRLEIKSNPNFCYKCGFDLRKITELLRDGDIFYKEDKCPDAIECYEKVIKIDSNNALAWCGKGNVLLKQGKNSEDVTYCVKCHLSPVLSEAFYNDAVKCYEKATKINPKFKDAWYKKGVALERLGKDSEAKRCFEIAKELNLNQI